MHLTFSVLSQNRRLCTERELAERNRRIHFRSIENLPVDGFGDVSRFDILIRHNRIDIIRNCIDLDSPASGLFRVCV